MKSRPGTVHLSVCASIVLMARFVYLVDEALNIFPVQRHGGLLNANVHSVAEQRQQLSAERVLSVGCNFVGMQPCLVGHCFGLSGL